MNSFINKSLILPLLVLFSCSNDMFETTNDGTNEIEIFDGPTLSKIRIDTDGVSIVDEPKISARLEILEEDEVVEAHQIGIEIRGSSSQMFDKKSYGFETWDENGEDLNVELAGFPEEEDWILYGPYSDKSLLRNVIIYELSNEMGQYASRTALYNLEINDVFLGTYVLMEKIKSLVTEKVYARNENFRLGFGNNKINWDIRRYEYQRKKLKQLTILKNKK